MDPIGGRGRHLSERLTVEERDARTWTLLDQLIDSDETNPDFQLSEDHSRIRCCGGRAKVAEQPGKMFNEQLLHCGAQCHKEYSWCVYLWVQAQVEYFHPVEEAWKKHGASDMCVESDRPDGQTVHSRAESHTGSV